MPTQPASRAPGPPAPPPALLVGVDTEADDQWSEAGRKRLDVGNAERLPALQKLCDAFAVRPTYLVTWEMATEPSSAAILRSLLDSGRCEIGAHLHPWSSPPRRPEDLRGTYPSQLPDALLERQLRELTEAIQTHLGVRPVSYRAGRHGFDARSLSHLETLGYRVDSSVDPLFNESRRGGPCFAGAPVQPYRLDRTDVRRAGDSSILEIPVTAATAPPLPKPLEAAYCRIPPLPWRGALRRFGLRGVWLRPSYTPVDEAVRLARRLVGRGQPCLNVLFHSSELRPGGSPYTPDEDATHRFLDDLARLFGRLTCELGAVGRTYAEFAAAS